jgi:hypothetical protein
MDVLRERENTMAVLKTDDSGKSKGWRDAKSSL